MSRTITPAQLVEHRNATIYDIRTREEREVMGWIPGALHRPGAETVAELNLLDDSNGLAVVACATGRRSAELVERLSGARPELTDLLGGLLSWQQDHVICRMSEAPPEDSKVPLTEYVRQVRSCFVVESVESGAIEDPEADPVSAVNALFADLQRPCELKQVWDRIDLLAHEAWRQGHRLDFIALHVVAFYELAERLDCLQS